MAESQHTKGTWYDLENVQSPCLTVVNEAGKTLAVVMESGEGYEVDEANARLMSESPAMYDVLVMVRDGKTLDARYFARHILARLHGEQGSKGGSDASHD